MKVKRIGDKIQATIEPSEILHLPGVHPVDPDARFKSVRELVQAGVWYLLQVHALKELDGMRIGYGRVDVINGSFVVTFGPASINQTLKHLPHD